MNIFQSQNDDNIWIRWVRFSKKGSFWVHIPILQPFVHFTYFIILITIDRKIQKNRQNYTDFAKNLESNKKPLEEKSKEALEYGNSCSSLLTDKNDLLATFLDLKLLEAFLEAGPQFAFQVSVMVQDGISSETQIFTTVTSALSLTWASSELFLKYPTEVIQLKHYVSNREK